MIICWLRLPRNNERQARGSRSSRNVVDERAPEKVLFIGSARKRGGNADSMAKTKTETNGADARAAGRIVDAHVHIIPQERMAGLMRWIHRAFPGHPVPADIDCEGALADIEAGGARRFFNMAYPLTPDETDALNRFNFELTRKLPQAVGWGSLHPENPDRAGITRRCLTELGFIGMKFHPFVQKFSIFDQRMTPVYETLSEMKRPLIIHTGFDEFYRTSMPARDVRRLISSYPDMPLVISHMLFPDIGGAFDIMEEFPSALGDLTNVPGALRLLALSKGLAFHETPEMAALEKRIPAFADRLLFGSDHPAGMGGYGEIYGDFFNIRMAERDRESILRGNAEAIVERYLPGRWD